MTSIANRFEKFVKLLLELHEYRIVGDDIGKGYDFKAVKTNKISLIEVKAFRTKHTPSLDKALYQLSTGVQSTKSFKGILVLTSIVEPSIAKDIISKNGIEIWDRNVLFYLTKNNYDLRWELERILNELKASPEEDIYDGLADFEKFTPVELNTIFRVENRTEHVPPKGQILWDNLMKITPGREEATKFEEHCTEIVKYIFDEDLSNWTPQNKTEDTLHRFDLIAGIISSNDFWKVLARDFKTRFAIFEFKNYTDPIGQNQIYSTEKYLYTTALRSFAIIISRQDPSKNAEIAMKGALRENGKLIISINLNEIGQLLHMKDKGDDPNTFISNKIDQMLMQLSR